MTLTVDDLDVKIIRILQENSRESYRDIADKLGVAEGTVYNRVSKLKGEGIIKRFMIEVDFPKLGYDLTVLIGIIVDGGHLPEIEKKISESSNVSAAYDVTGEYDVIVVAKFKTRDELNGFVKRLLAMPYVRRTYTMVVLNVLKEVHGVGI